MATRIQRKGGVADYSFAFDESRFSDRTLHIVTSTEPQEELRCLQEDDDNGALQNSFKNATEMAQETSSNVTVTHHGNRAIEVRTVQVNSAILAESSQFFNKLFSSGMWETEQRHATIHISPSEEQAFIHLLKFIYGGTIETQSTKELLDVLILADKFGVPSCMHGCTNALDSIPMTMEFASLILCLPSSLLTADVMLSIVKAAKGFLLTHFSKRKFVEKYMNLPLDIIEEVLKSDELHVSSEDYIYDFAMNWVNRHYHDQDERREVFQNKLIKLIRFPQMTDYKLAEILSNENMHSASALKLVSEALNFKRGSLFESYNSEDKKFYKRFYEQRPIRAMQLHTPETEYRVFCDFNDREKHQSSETFYMWGQPFSLSFSSLLSFYICNIERLTDGVELECPMEYVVFLRSKLSNEFCDLSRGKLTFVSRRNAILSNFTESSIYNFNNVIQMQVVFK